MTCSARAAPPPGSPQSRALTKEIQLALVPTPEDLRHHRDGARRGRRTRRSTPPRTDSAARLRGRGGNRQRPHEAEAPAWQPRRQGPQEDRHGRSGPAEGRGEARGREEAARAQEDRAEARARDLAARRAPPAAAGPPPPAAEAGAAPGGEARAPRLRARP